MISSEQAGGCFLPVWRRCGALQGVNICSTCPAAFGGGGRDLGDLGARGGSGVMDRNKRAFRVFCRFPII